MCFPSRVPSGSRSTRVAPASSSPLLGREKHSRVTNPPPHGYESQMSHAHRTEAWGRGSWKSVKMGGITFIRAFFLIFSGKIEVVAFKFECRGSSVRSRCQDLIRLHRDQPLPIREVT